MLRLRIIGAYEKEISIYKQLQELRLISAVVAIIIRNYLVIRVIRIILVVVTMIIVTIVSLFGGPVGPSLSENKATVELEMTELKLNRRLRQLFLGHPASHKCQE